MKFLKRLAKRLYVKFKLKTRYKWLQEDKLKMTEAEKVCLSICRSMISHTESKFLIAPISMKRYIKNDLLGLFIILEDRNISVTNHVYHYDVKLSQREWDRICNMYDLKTEKLRESYEEEIMQQIKHSLTKIKDKITHLNEISQN
jgi:hypothetical protein